MEKGNKSILKLWDWCLGAGGWCLLAGGDPSDSHRPAGGSAESISACLSDAMQPACVGADGALAGWQGMGIGWGGYAVR